MQMAGRTLRPWNDTCPIILDHGGNVDRHGMPHEDRQWSLDAKPKRASNGGPPMRVCEACYAYVPASCKACPHCGAASVAKGRAPAADVEDVALAQRTREQIIRDTPLPEWAMALEGKAAKVFQSLLRRAIASEYKRGWVRHRFEAVMRFPLPKEWAERIGA
jgi:hypothetical protein